MEENFTAQNGEEAPIVPKKRGRGRPRKNESVNSQTSNSDSISYIDYLPDKNQEVCEQHLEMFFDTMLERQLIWKNRFVDKIEAPWTDDPYFKEHKFTNLYRELDRSSQYLINNIIRDESNSLKNIVWKIIVYRMFNSPEAFKALSFIWKAGIPDYEDYENDKDKFVDVVDAIKATGGKLFTSAYIISSSLTPGETREHCYTKVVMPAIHKNIDKIMDICLLAENPEDIIKVLRNLPCVEKFIAHELYSDLIYINKYSKYQIFSFDANSFTNVGPGSSLGIRLIYPAYNNAKEQLQGIYRLLSIAEEQLKLAEQRKGESMPYTEWNTELGRYVITDKFNLTLSQIEGWLCEFSKYWKMYISKGKQRQHFVEKSSNDAYDLM